ncbi:MAG: DUF4113 domain-containing protein [Alphaproteobacteria bacterium]
MKSIANTAVKPFFCRPDAQSQIIPQREFKSPNFTTSWNELPKAT